MTIDDAVEKVRCGACGQVTGFCRNLVELDRKAKWDYPTAGNVLTGESGKAVAFACDKCVRDKAQVREAVEFKGDALVYHAVEDLEPVPPARRSLTWFAKHVEEGPDCTCSWCGEPILDPEEEAVWASDEEDNPDEFPAIRLWKGKLEARLHPRCLREAVSTGALLLPTGNGQ